jgi:L-ascorbate metabolism protein UlaG (beta-lactamase superfamily)
MRITFVGHASILIETRGVAILSDPWWRGPCFGAQWWAYPAPKAELIGKRVDFIYISHGHHDHFHPGTLRTLNRDATCLVSRATKLAEPLRELGFKAIEFDDDDNLEICPGVHCRVIETYALDTLFTVDDGMEVCFNLNDALHAAPTEVQDQFIARLRSLFPKIDYVFCGYGVASHFPNCYEIPGKDREATAARRQDHFTAQWVRIIHGLAPRFGFPFAAGVAFLEKDLLWTNEATFNTERPTAAYFKKHAGGPTTVVDIAPGFTIVDGIIESNLTRQSLSLEQLSVDCADDIRRANSYGAATEQAFEEVMHLIRQNIDVCRPYLLEFEEDYAFLLRFRNFPSAISIKKTAATFTIAREPKADDKHYEISYATRLHYVKWSLTSEYGHEILFVGSGGTFSYSRASDAQRNLHREFAVMLVPHTRPPKSRFGDNSPTMYRLKRFVGRRLKRIDTDLYDLGSWTVWRS